MPPGSLKSNAIHAIYRLWSRTRAYSLTNPRWLTRALIIILLLITTIIIIANLNALSLPHLRLEYTSSSLPSSPFSSSHSPLTSPSTPFNTTKLALLIESRPLPLLAPLLLHFTTVLPPDWRIRFMGSPSSLSVLNTSASILSHIETGKLELTHIPPNMSTQGQEMISRFLTNLWLYETVLAPTEWLLIFQTDSILCANSRRNLNDYLEYDWVGAPWNPNGRYGGNGGLSLRRVSAIIEILREQVRANNSEPEDVWLTERLGNRPGARMANGSLSLTFSGEMNSGQNVQAHRLSASSSSPAGEPDDEYYIEGVDDWRDGFYEPMGYHTGSSGSTLHGSIWGNPRLRQHIWDYCPEVKMTLAMDAAKYVPGDCNAYWKRNGEDVEGGLVGIEDVGHGSEIIDGVVYPMLPPTLVPW